MSVAAEADVVHRGRPLGFASGDASHRHLLRYASGDAYDRADALAAIRP